MMELFTPRTRGAHPGKEAPLDSLGMDARGITFRVCHPKRTHESHQPIVPCGDGTFPAIQLPLLGKELLLQLDGHH
jgi:hypothetical protein